MSERDTCLSVLKSRSLHSLYKYTARLPAGAHRRRTSGPDSAAEGSSPARNPYSRRTPRTPGKLGRCPLSCRRNCPPDTQAKPSRTARCPARPGAPVTFSNQRQKATGKTRPTHVHAVFCCLTCPPGFAVGRFERWQLQVMSRSRLDECLGKPKATK